MRNAVVFVFLMVTTATGVVLVDRAGTTTTTTSTTTTTIAPERAQPGWTVVSRSARGVMVDYRVINVAGVAFSVIRMHARTTLVRWHVGSTDPNLAARAPSDAGPSIDWPSEGPAGVLAVFNGGFKQAANAGGAVADGFALVHLTPGFMTIGLDNAGHWAMGVWGAVNFPPKGFHAISWRQNLAPLVAHGAPTPAALSTNYRQWGDPLGGWASEPRSALGVDAHNNLIYVATMAHVLVPPLATALARAGAVTGMELDINPFWPVFGATSKPMHVSGAAFPVQMPFSQHNPSMFETGWIRDFFVALAEPNSWSCNWVSRGLSGKPGVVGTPQPQPLRLTGTNCNVVTTTTTTTTTTATTSTSTTTTSTTTGP